MRSEQQQINSLIWNDEVLFWTRIANHNSNHKRYSKGLERHGKQISVLGNEKRVYEKTFVTDEKKAEFYCKMRSIIIGKPCKNKKKLIEINKRMQLKCYLEELGKGQGF